MGLRNPRQFRTQFRRNLPPLSYDECFQDPCSRCSMLFLLNRKPIFITPQTTSNEEYHVLGYASLEEIFTPRRKNRSARHCKRSANELYHVLGKIYVYMQKDALQFRRYWGTWPRIKKQDMEKKIATNLRIVKEGATFEHQTNKPVAAGASKKAWTTNNTRNNRLRIQLQPFPLITGPSLK